MDLAFTSAFGFGACVTTIHQRALDSRVNTTAKRRLHLNRRCTWLPAERSTKAHVRMVQAGAAGTGKANGILLVDHGSKREAANNMLSGVRDTVAERLGAGAIVHIAHMELAEPSIEDGFAKCVEDGAQHVVVVPFFLAPGRHCTTDIPAMAAEAAAAIPGCTFEIREHLGTHPALVDAVVDRAMSGAA